MGLSMMIPVVRYRDCTAALRFLTQVFGFAAGVSFRDEAGNIIHAELWAGDGAIMIGPVKETPFSGVMRQPNEAGGVTASLYVVTDDPDADHARAVDAGFEIVLPLRDEPYGSREFSVRDPEGQVWTFGTYRPAPTG